MAGFSHGAGHGQLTINSVPLMNYAWRCTNLAVLGSLKMRGESILIPTVTGRKTRRRRVDEAVIGLELLVIGTSTSAGAAVTATSTARMDALWDNLLALETVALPPTSDTGHAITWLTPNNTSRTGYGFVQSWEVQPDESGAPFARVAFDLVIPAGRLS